MLSDAQLAANKANAAFSTGPRTEPGKSRSSRNALTFGLFTLNDFVRENETEDYTKICTSLWTELTPEGTVEEFLTTELMSATWRLRRCRMVEEDLAEITTLDPMQDPETQKQQKSVDRARAQSHSIFHRCLAALRKVQTERGIRCQAFPESGPPEGLGLMDFLQVSKVKPLDQTTQPGPASPQPAPTEPDFPDAGMDALMALAEHQLAQRYREQGLAGFTGVPTPTPAAQATAPAPMASNCKPAAAVPVPTPNFPRNALCRCGSGAKYKRCCGKDAAPVLGRAA
jgi:hypothetical protein